MKKAFIAAAMLIAAEAQATLYVNGFLATGNVATNFPTHIYDNGVYSGDVYGISFDASLVVRSNVGGIAYVDSTGATGSPNYVLVMTNVYRAVSTSATDFVAFESNNTDRTIAYYVFCSTNGAGGGGGDTFATNLIENAANVDSVASPTAGHVMTWNGTAWSNAAAAGGSSTNVWVGFAVGHALDNRSNSTWATSTRTRILFMTNATDVIIDTGASSSLGAPFFNVTNQTFRLLAGKWRCDLQASLGSGVVAYYAMYELGVNGQVPGTNAWGSYPAGSYNAVAPADGQSPFYMIYRSANASGYTPQTHGGTKDFIIPSETNILEILGTQTAGAGEPNIAWGLLMWTYLGP